MKQLKLALSGGSHIGPLFIPVKRRAPKGRYDSSKRWRLTKRRTPLWADRREIAMIVRAGRRLKLSVDHIVPLHHPLVCGLHVENNLRLIPLLSNLSRGNNEWWPDAPFEQMRLL